MNPTDSHIEIISNKDEIYAIIIRSKFHQEGIKFFTPDDFSQQLGYMSHKAGHKIPPHIHNFLPREVKYTQEVLLIKYGKVRVEFYTNEKTYFKSSLLLKGDVILLANAGHGFYIEEDAAMIEIKQGPYLGDKDKTRFIEVK